MRIVKQILVFSSVLLLTWLTVGFVAWIFAKQLGCKECLLCGATFVTMIFIGWMPALLVTLKYREIHLKP